MYKIRIITVGKIKEKWLQLALLEYEKRLKKLAYIEWVLKRCEKELYKAVEKEKSFICLDEKGIFLDSENFSKKVLTIGSKICFLMGGDMGISKDIQKKALFTLSLSKLTFTHQMTRLILLEQIYRSFEIEKGSPYHK